MTENRFRWAVIVLLIVLVLVVARPSVNFQAWQTDQAGAIVISTSDCPSGYAAAGVYCVTDLPIVGHWTLDIGPIHFGEAR